MFLKLKVLFELHQIYLRIRQEEVNVQKLFPENHIFLVPVPVPSTYVDSYIGFFLNYLVNIWDGFSVAHGVEPKVNEMDQESNETTGKLLSELFLIDFVEV